MVVTSTVACCLPVQGQDEGVIWEQAGGEHHYKKRLEAQQMRYL